MLNVVWPSYQFLINLEMSLCHVHVCAEVVCIWGVCVFACIQAQVYEGWCALCGARTQCWVSSLIVLLFIYWGVESLTEQELSGSASYPAWLVPENHLWTEQVQGESMWRNETLSQSKQYEEGLSYSSAAWTLKLESGAGDSAQGCLFHWYLPSLQWAYLSDDFMVPKTVLSGHHFSWVTCLSPASFSRVL